MISRNILRSAKRPSTQIDSILNSTKNTLVFSQFKSSFSLLTRHDPELKYTFKQKPLAPPISISNKRTFKRIEVTSPLGIRLLRLSKILGLTILICYIVGTGVFVFLYYGHSSRSDNVQPIPDDWPFKVKQIVREGVNNELEMKYDRALKLYKAAIEQLTTEEDPITKQRVPIKELDKKSKEWLKGYSDLLVRYARLEELFENSKDAKAALISSEAIPWGTPDLKSIAAIQLGKYALTDGEKEKAEQYFINGVKAVATRRMRHYFEEGPDQDINKAVLIPDPLHDTAKGAPVNENDGLPTGEGITKQLYIASIELGKYYASVGNYKRAMEVLLSTLRSIRRKREPEGRSLQKIPDPDCFEARTMSYISETLWAAGKSRQKDAISWAEGSYREALPLSNSTVECGLCATMTLENLIKMYKAVGLDEEVEKTKNRLADVHTPLTNAQPGWSLTEWLGLKQSR